MTSQITLVDGRWQLPGIVNQHSHAFQRAMAGLAERMTNPTDSFWTWRETMYRMAARFDPDQLHAVASQLYAEMLEAGYTTVCEFHYLHHAPDGRPYDDPATMSRALIAAARDTGIRLTLLPVLYMTGLLGACPTFDHAGLLTRTAEDAAITLATIVPAADGRGLAGEAFLDAHRAAVARGPRGLRLGVVRDYFFDNLEPGVRRAVDETIEHLRAAGAQVRDVPIGVTGRLYDVMFGPIAVSEIRATYARAFRARPDAFSKDFAAVFDGAGPTAAAVVTAREARDAVQRGVEAALVDVDVLVTPTVPVVAPPIAGPIDGMAILRNTWAFNAARVPAVSVPCGSGAHGLPVGVQLVGRPFGEPALLAAATFIERLGAA